MDDALWDKSLLHYGHWCVCDAQVQVWLIEKCVCVDNLSEIVWLIEKVGMFVWVNKVCMCW